MHALRFLGLRIQLHGETLAWHVGGLEFDPQHQAKQNETMVPHACCNPSTQEAKIEGLQIWDWSKLQNNSIFKV